MLTGMVNLRYELTRLLTDYYLSGVSERYRRGRRVPPPRTVVWDCTRRCNLACVHCGATKERYASELTSGQITAVVDELAALKVDMFSATGGEPLVRKDVLDVLAHARQRGLKAGLATNGFLVDEAMARRIRAAGVSSVQVSLDGLESTHNGIRNNPHSFARATRAIELLIGESLPLVSAATTVTPCNIGELERLGELIARLGCTLWRLTVVMPIGRASETDLLLDGRQMAALFAFVRSRRRQKPHVYIGENLTFLGAWERQIRREPMVCPIGFLACCIGVDGHVRGCPEQPDTVENREGSVLEAPFSAIWQRGFGRYRRREVLTTDERCAACRDRHTCYGGCWVMRERGDHCIHELMADRSSR